ncbi:MAG: hypothetical protein VYD20_07380 [Candidatus Neomarinimicrobiota bacterium]|jgi:hypothetical protein|nr:hypothetical protein [Candidatus Neomarinimicrobiota bacterium]MED5256331.1 hypothetical protein [Candidatus Neomarinimicrobiota bacterium]|tara:strand:+ start:55 stop:738 length:684 start_codon:yes stop_codon:yes gene_type:complete
MKNLFARGGIEFLAVLLGISGSLWIENNRESNLENEQIYNTLYSLKEELVTLQEYSERYKGKIIRDYNICDNILVNWGNIDIDSLVNQKFEGRNLVLTIKAYRAFHPPISIFNSLKSDGSIGLIKNPNIKMKINNVYEVSFSHIQEGVDNERILYQKLNEYIILNYPYLLINDDSNEYKEALREFLNDEIALAYIIEKNSMRNFLSRLISRYISRVNDLSILIDSEI